MLLTFKDIKNIHKGKKAYVLGNGPSLNSWKDKILDMKKEGILFGCSVFYEYYKSVPDYWVLADPNLTIRRFVKEIKEFDVTVMYPDVVDFTPKEFIEENEITALPFDRMHFDDFPCVDLPWYEHFKNWDGDKLWKCCDGYTKGRLTIQEELQKHTGYKKHYSKADTVILHSLSLAIMMGCNPINVIGFDWDYTKGYSHLAGTQKSGEVEQGTINHTKVLAPKIMEDIDIVVASAKKIGTKMYNLNKKSWFKNIPIA